MKNFRSFVLPVLVCLWLPLRLFAVDTRFLVMERAFVPTNADPREVKLGLAFGTDSKIQAVSGAHVALVALRFSTGFLEELHFGLEGAGFFSLRSEASRFPLETVDGLIGFFTEAKANNWTGQLRYTHLSAHLADGSGGIATPFSREQLSLRAGWMPFNSLNLYAGIHVLVHSIPSGTTPSLQGGFTYFLPLKNSKFTPFASSDIQWRRDVPINPSWSMQIGMALKEYEERYRSFRVFYQYYTGADFRGQLADRSYTSHSLGIDISI